MLVRRRHADAGLSVADLDAQRRFYAGAFGLTELEETVEMPEVRVRTAILRAGNGLKIELIECGGVKDPDGNLLELIQPAS